MIIQNKNGEWASLVSSILDKVKNTDYRIYKIRSSRLYGPYLFVRDTYTIHDDDYNEYFNTALFMITLKKEY